MRIYFAAAITAGREHAPWYPKLLELLRRHGEITSEHFASQELTDQGDYTLSPEAVHSRDMAWLLASDAVVADITVPSLGVGYEIGRAVENGKRVLCLYHVQPGKRASAMVRGSPKVTTRSYLDITEARQHVDEFFTQSENKKVLTLAFVQHKNTVLLGRKKRGFGAGKWNGFGGKVEANETIEEAARRELLEEACIGTVAVERRGLLTFRFSGDPTALEVHVFRARSHTGEPNETDEMEPRWFAQEDIPYDEMWADDKLWLPLFLADKRFEGEFWFDDEKTIERFTLNEL